MTYCYIDDDDDDDATVGPTDVPGTTVGPTQPIDVPGTTAGPTQLPDTTAGPNPMNLTLILQTSTSITIVWSSGDFSSFRIEYNGESIDVRGSTMYTLEGLTPNTFYSITLTAINGTESSESEIFVTTKEGGEEYVITLV